MVVGTRLWQDATGMPAVLADVAGGAAGTDATADLLRRARRVVVTGNGAAAYAGLALWTAAVAFPADSGPEVVVVPAGMLGGGRFAWRPGDVPLVLSSSGELRDVVALLEPDPGGPALPRPYALVTATPGSTLAAGATELVHVPVRAQDAVTHTQAFVGNVLAVLLLWQRVAGRDLGLRAAEVAERCAADVAAAPGWAGEAVGTLGRTHPVAATAFGSGGGWPAALEAALLLKEVGGVPTEGMETREGATTGMYALRAGHLVVAVPTPEDPDLDEAVDVCRRTGAGVLRLPVTGPEPSGLLAPVTAFPGALALAAELGLRAGLDVDEPAWTAAYYATARTSGAAPTPKEEP